MTDIMSVLASSYRSSSLSAAPSKTKYVAVDPKLYQGTWTGKYANNKSFTINITDVSGFHAKVRYQSDGTVKYQDVLIKDSAFRVGDSKFTLTGSGKALIKNAVTDPATGSTYLDTAYATLQK
jgi:lipocalin